MGCPEVCINALKYKQDGKCSPAFDVRKPKWGEVAYCPSFPLGESNQSLERMRAKMEKTFALKRQEILCDAKEVRKKILNSVNVL